MSPRLVLASSSPHRHALLDRLGLAYRIDAPDIDESRLPDESPRDYVARLALAKAEAVRPRHPHALVIGSDQAAVRDGAVLGKPGNHARAAEQLAAASGRSVLFLTGLSVLDAASGRARTEVVPFTVHFRPLSAETIERYLRAERPYGCAGSFMSEGLGISLFERLEGDDPTALIGLPLITLVSLLAAEGVHIP